MVAGVVDGLVARICIGLPAPAPRSTTTPPARCSPACVQCDGAIGLAANDEVHRAPGRRRCDSWPTSTGCTACSPAAAAACCSTRASSPPDEAARRLGLALSPANAPAQAAAWVEGFLRGSGLLLLHDDALWSVLDDWVAALPPRRFTAVLPLLRRTFSAFAAAERRQIGERVKRGGAEWPPPRPAAAQDFDAERADGRAAAAGQILGAAIDPK